ncbi:site-specific integrase [Halomonas cerina]|uniref:Integrase n=1 Tax=Halomonas cerina TaxID=447424 RepID=A0A839VA65_9GAMM|nr:site-specific integrase [Halomonas cerina]MBB3189426.1 integrase [Halomonas cerina]
MTQDVHSGTPVEPDEVIVELERLPQAVKRLSARARRHIANSVSKNTIRGMRADLRVYQRAGGLLPADEFDIANFIADQRALGKKPATLERYLNSLHMWHRYMALPSPVKHMAVRAVMRGIRRSAGIRQKEAPPLLLDDLQRLLDHIDRSTLLGKRDSALFALCFHGAFRRSEVVALYLEDMQWETRGVILGLRRSKTNQEGLHETKPILRAPAQVRYCPVRLLEAWLAASGIQRGAVFRSVGPAGRLGAGRMSDPALYQRLMRHLAAADMADRGFTPHSFRAGFITEAHRQGKSDRAIKRISGHRSQRTFERYIRHTDDFEDHAGDFYPGVEEKPGMWCHPCR